MYALDQAAGKPVRALYRRRANGLEWILASEIPRAEQRVLATLGTLTIPDDRPISPRHGAPPAAKHEVGARVIRHGIGRSLGRLLIAA
jgi:hypothetical protein